jgi:hypothetical protein
MNYFAHVGLLAAIVPASAQAICMTEPLEPKLRAADTVYVGTVVRSELVPSLESLRGTKSKWDRLVQVRHTVVPEITFKGDPSQASIVVSRWQYNDPNSKVVVSFAERLAPVPGDTLLVVVEKPGEPAGFGLCTPTQEWNADSARAVHAVFPPAP